jgi:hypothetical protein
MGAFPARVLNRLEKIILTRWWQQANEVKIARLIPAWCERPVGRGRAGEMVR